MFQGGGSLNFTWARMDLSPLIRKELQIRAWGSRDRNSNHILHVGNVYNFLFFLLYSPQWRIFNIKNLNRFKKWKDEGTRERNWHAPFFLSPPSRLSSRMLMTRGDC